MNPSEMFNYLQLAIFLLGVLAILIAGYQDKKTRRAPAIYLVPTLIGFGLNPMLGLFGMVMTFIAIVFWKDEWNEKVGLADALLFITVLFCLTNILTLLLTFIITLGVFGELILSKKDKQPLIWIASKWILVVLFLFVITLLLR